MATYSVGSLAGFWGARYADRFTMNGTYNITASFSMAGTSSINIEDYDHEAPPGQEEGTQSHALPTWVPIGMYTWPEGHAGQGDESEEGYFTGTINGNGHTLSNLTFTYSSGDDWGGVGGLVGFLGGSYWWPGWEFYKGYINDLTLNTVTSYYSYNVGSFAGAFGGGAITNCHVKNFTAYGDEDEYYEGLWTAGAIAGSMTGDSSSAITNCTVDGCYMAPGFHVGGLVGNAGKDMSSIDPVLAITNCSVTNGLISNSVSGDEAGLEAFSNVGGFMGYSKGVEIDKCFCEVDILQQSGDYEAYNVGGFIGEVYAAEANEDITDCYCISNIEFNPPSSGYYVQYVGGFIGNMSSNGSDILNCYAYGTLTLGGNLSHSSTGHVGGFMGRCYGRLDRANFTHTTAVTIYRSIIRNCFAVMTMTIGTTIPYLASFIGAIYTRTGYHPREPEIRDNSYWTGNIATERAINYISNRAYYDPYSGGGTSYIIGNIIEQPANSGNYYVATESFSSTDFAGDIADGKLIPATPNVYSSVSGVNLEDGSKYIYGDDGTGYEYDLEESMGTDETNAVELSYGDHNVYRYWQIAGISHPHRWSLYPNKSGSTIENSTWFNQFWLPHIYPTFVYPGEGPFGPGWTVPLPINYYSDAQNDPIQFRER